MKIAFLALAAAAASSGGAAPAVGPAPPTSGDCFSAHDIRGHSVADSRTLLLDVAGRATYRATMKNGCLRTAISSDRLGLTLAGSAKVCAPRDLELSIRGQRCVVDSLARLSPEEAAALPPKLRP